MRKRDKALSHSLTFSQSHFLPVSLSPSLTFALLLALISGFGLADIALSAPPDTRILSGPEGRIGYNHAEFRWIGLPEPGQRIFGYYYALDDTPAQFTNDTVAQFQDLSAEEHAFRVWAVDGAFAQDPEPAEQGFAILPTVQDELESNNSPNDATSTIPDIRIVGRSFDNTDPDWFRFTLQQKQLTIGFQRTNPGGEAAPLSDSSTRLNLYPRFDPNTPIATFTVDRSTSQRGLFSLGLRPGEYLLEVIASGITSLSGETYELTLGEVAMATGGQWELEPNAIAESAQTLTLDAQESTQTGFVLGRVDSPDDEDWYKLHVSASAVETGNPASLLRLRLERTGAKGETLLRLYRSLPIVQERQVGQLVIDSVTDQQAESELAVVLGDYYLQVTPSQEATDSVYTLLLDVSDFAPGVVLELEPNNASPAVDPTASDLLRSDQLVGGNNWDGDADIDWFRIVVPSDGTLAIWMSRPLGIGTTQVQLYSQNLAPLGMTALNPGNAQQVSLVRPVRAGTAYVQLSPQGEIPSAPYRLIASFLPEAGHDALAPVKAQQPIHFRVAWVPGNRVSYTLVGEFADPRVADRLREQPLSDDGLHGDGDANDGIYAASYTPQFGDDVPQAEVQFLLTDAQGREIAFTTQPPLQIDTLVPVLDSVTHDSIGILQPGQELKVTLVGEAGLQGTFDIKGFREFLPLSETEPGRYVGAYRVQPGDKVSGARLLGRLVDVAGNETTRAADTLVHFASEGPVLLQLTHTADRPLRLNDSFEVTLTAQPNLQAEAQLGSPESAGYRRFALPEVGSGTYRATYRVQDGDRLQEGQLSVVATNAQGLTSTLTHPAPITLDGVRPAPVQGVIGEDLPDDQGGRLRIRWEPSTDADLLSYNVYLANSPVVATTGLNPALQYLRVTEVELEVPQNRLDYYLAVTALDAVGNESLPTATAQAGPVQALDNLAPLPVSRFVAFDTPDDTGHRVTLRWTPSEIASDFDHYAIYLSLTPIEGNLEQAGVIARVSNPALTVRDISQLADGVDYYFGLSVVDTSGNRSALLSQTVVGPVRSENNLVDEPVWEIGTLVAPTGILRDSRALFLWSRFVGGQAVISYRYRLDSDTERSTSSNRLILSDLSPDAHVLQVRALDAGGRVLGTNRHRFTVDPFLLSGTGAQDSAPVLDVTIAAQADPAGSLLRFKIEDSRFKIGNPKSQISNLKSQIFTLGVLIKGEVQAQLWRGGALLARSSGVETPGSTSLLVASVRPGDYQLQVLGQGSYQLSAICLQPSAVSVEKEPNDTQDSATDFIDLTSGAAELVSGAKSADDVDWWQFRVPQGRPVRLNVSSFATGTWALVDEASEPTFVYQVSTSDVPTLNVPTSVVRTDTGRVWIRVEAQNLTSLLHLYVGAEVVSEPTEIEPNDTLSSATLLEGIGETSFAPSVSGSVWDSQDVDWFRLDLSEMGILVLSAAPEMDVPLSLKLYDGASNLLAEGTMDGGAAGSSHLDWPVSPGSYWIACSIQDSRFEILDLQSSIYNLKSQPYRLDYALVTEAQHDAVGTLELGDSFEVHLRWEVGGSVTLDMGDFQRGIALPDDGAHGDGAAEDGLFAAVVPVADGIQGENVPLTLQLATKSGQNFRAILGPPFDIDTVTSPIRSVTHDASGPLPLGASLRVTLEGVPGESASFDVADVYRGVPLFDDGLHGDGQADDGTYSGQLTVRTTDDVRNATVRVTLQKPNGRQVRRDVSRPVTLDGVRPASPTGLVAEDFPDDEGGLLKLRWEVASSDDVVRYEVYLSPQPVSSIAGLQPVLSVSTLNVSTLNVPTSVDMFLAVVSVDAAGNRSLLTPGALAGPVQALDNRVPEPLVGVTTFDTPDDAGGWVTVVWEQPSTAPDFASYRVYLSPDREGNAEWGVRSGESEEGSSAFDIRHSTFLGELRVRELVSVDVPTRLDGVDYFVTVTVLDQAGNESRAVQTGPVQSLNNRTPVGQTSLRFLAAPSGIVRHPEALFVWNRFVLSQSSPTTDDRRPTSFSVYEYQLDDQPVATTTATRVSFGRLSNGSHQFAVRAEGESDWLVQHFTISAASFLESEPNDAEGEANRILTGRTMLGQLAGDPDVYRLDLHEPRLVVLTSYEFTSLRVTSLRVERPVFQLATRNSELATRNAQPKTLAFAADTGTYWFTWETQESASLDYRFSVELQPLDDTWEVEPNDAGAQNVASARPLLPGEEVRGIVQSPADQDWYSVIVPEQPEPTSLSWELVRESGIDDLRFEITDFRFEILDFRFEILDLQSSISNLQLPVAPGLYYLKLSLADPGVETGSVGYSLRIQFGDGTGQEVEPNETPELATRLSPGMPIEMSHATGTDRDWFRFDMDLPGIALVQWSPGSRTSEERLMLYDAVGASSEPTQVLQERSASSEMQIALPLSQGSYFLELTPTDPASVQASERSTLNVVIITQARHDAQGVLGVGDVLTAEVRWLPGQNVSASIVPSTLETRLTFPLFDDGAHADRESGDGFYAGEYVVRPGDLVQGGLLLLHLGEGVILRPGPELLSLLPPIDIDTLPPVIRTASHDAETALGAGAEVRFSVQTEPDAQVSVEISKPGWRVDRVAELFDDGAHGDGAEGDGVYGGTYQVSAQDNVTDAEVKVLAEDRAANRTSLTLARRITLDGVPPVILDLRFEILDLQSSISNLQLPVEGDAISVTVQSEPGLEGSFSIGDFRQQLPLLPLSKDGSALDVVDGVQTYQGRYLIRAGDRVLDAVLSVQLTDVAGNVAEAQAAQLIRIDTTPPGIDDLRFEILDFRSAIFNLKSTITGGATLIVTLTGEPGATASFDIGTERTDLPLFDDGAHQDGAAGDGVYRGEYVVQPGDAWQNLSVTARLVKANGKSTIRSAAQTLSVDTLKPDPVTEVFAQDLPDDEGFWIALQWKPSDAEDFSHYSIYRSSSPIGVLLGLTPFQRVESRGQSQLQVEVPQNDTNTYFAVVAVDSAGNISDLSLGAGGSVSPVVQAVDNLAPAPIPEVRAVDAPGDAGGTLNVSWGEPSAAEDFFRYNIYLDRIPILSLDGLRPVTSVTDRRLLSTEVRVDADEIDYYVAVAAEDRSGNLSFLLADSVSGPVQALDNSGGVGNALVQLVSMPAGEVRRNQVSFRWSRWSSDGSMFDAFFYQLDGQGFQFTRANEVSFYGLRDGTHQWMLKPTPGAVPLVHSFNVLTTVVEESEPNDQIVSANQGPSGLQIQGTTDSDGDLDWYLLPRPALGTPQANLSVLFSRSTGIGQSFITIFDAAFPEESASLGEFVVNAANRQQGRIFLAASFSDILIRVRGEGENPSAAYQLSAVFESPTKGFVQEIEPNNRVEDATLIPLDAREVTGIANRVDDVDWFRTQPSDVSSADDGLFLDLTFVRPLSVGVTQVQIYAGLPILPERQVAAFQLDPGVSQQWQWSTPVASGDYYIRLDQGGPRQTAPYTIRAALRPIPVGVDSEPIRWEAEPNGSRFAATPIELGQPVWGTSWHANDDQDWFRLRVPESGILSVGLERPGGAGETQIRLLNAGEAELQTASITPGSGQAASFSLAVTPGDYFIALDPAGEDTTLPYQLAAILVRALDHDADDRLGLGEVLTVELNVGRPNPQPANSQLATPFVWSIVEDALPVVKGLPLHDDGLSGDIAANDGIFTGTFTVPPETDVRQGRVVVQLSEHPPLLLEPVGERSLVLDSVPPKILDFRHDGTEPLGAGRDLLMRLVSEPGGEGFYELVQDDFLIRDELFDDGQHDDGPADDGVYGGRYTVQPGDNFDQLQVVGILFDAAGNESRKTALRKVIFDTRPPIIESVTHDAETTMRAGDFLRVQLRQRLEGEPVEAKGFSPLAEAEFDLVGFREHLPLYDDGTHGDLQAEDGVYSTAYFIEEGIQVQNTRLVGRLTDRAGNVAELDAEVLVTIDTVAPQIETITHNATRPLIRGETLRVQLRGEPGGKARFDIGDAITSLPLADDGAGEDEQANDGVYMGVYVVRIDDNVRDAVITGYLVDPSGNEEIAHAAVSVTLDAVPPAAIRDVTAEDLDGDEGHSVFVRWEAISSALDFSHYNIYAERSPIRSTRVLIPVATSLVLPEVTSAEITVPSNNVDYYIAVTAVDTANNESTLEPTSVAGPVMARDNIAPEAVIEVSAQNQPEDDGHMLLVSWTQTNTDEDFDRYEVFVATEPIEALESLKPAAGFRNRNLVEVPVPVPEDGVDYYVAVISRDVNENPSLLDAEGRSVAGPVQSLDEVAPLPVGGVVAVDTPGDGGDSVSVGWESRLQEGIREYRLYVDRRPFALGLPDPAMLEQVISDEASDVAELILDGTSAGWYIAVTAVDFGGNESEIADSSQAGPVTPVDNLVRRTSGTVVAAGFDPLTHVKLEPGAVDWEGDASFAPTVDIFNLVDSTTTDRILEADHFLEPAHIDPAHHEALSSTLREVVLSGGTLVRDATLQISYPDLDTEDIEKDLRIFQLDTSGEMAQWQLVSGVQNVDTGLNTVSATIHQFGVFRVSRLQLPGNLNNVVVFPNPFVPSESVSKRVTFLNLTAQATVEIYTLEGRRVRAIEAPFSSGRATWDGRYENGDKAATGLYYYVVYSDTDKTVGRLLVVR